MKPSEALELAKHLREIPVEEAAEKLRGFVKKHESECLNFPFTSQAFMQAWDSLLEEPKWRNKTDKAFQQALNKLGRYSEEVAIIAIEDAIASNYQGIFPQNVKLQNVTFETEAQKRLRQANNLSEALQNGQVTWKS